MGLRVALHHKTTYHYDRPVTLGPQVVRLRPAPHCRTPILAYSLRVTPAERVKEAPYIQRNINATRTAFGIDHCPPPGGNDGGISYRCGDVPTVTGPSGNCSRRRSVPTSCV